MKVIAAAATPANSQMSATSFCASTGQNTQSVAKPATIASIDAPARVALKPKSKTIPMSGAAKPSRIIFRIAVSGENVKPATKYTAVAKAATTASPPSRTDCNNSVTTSPTMNGATPPCTAG